MINSEKLLSKILYSGYLKKCSNKELLSQCFKHVYGEVKFNKKGLVIEEMMDRMDNEKDVMAMEIKRGIL